MSRRFRRCRDRCVSRCWGRSKCAGGCRRESRRGRRSFRKNRKSSECGRGLVLGSFLTSEVYDAGLYKSRKNARDDKNSQHYRDDHGKRFALLFFGRRSLGRSDLCAAICAEFHVIVQRCATFIAKHPLSPYRYSGTYTPL